MRLFFVLGLFLATACQVMAQEQPNWMRYQSISPDGKTIAFTYKGDLYTIPVTGGEAKQITFHEAHDFMAVWSPDSKQIAFASDRYGNFDVFVMPAMGGEARRLTYHSNPEKPFAFSHDGSRVIFGGLRQDAVNHRQFPTSSQPELYSVPVSVGRVDQLFTIPAEYVQVSPDGKTMLYHDKKGGENEFRKHHTSSITRDIWSYNTETKAHKMLTSHDAEDRQPVFINNKEFYFLSERSGTFNVWKASVEDAENPVQITSFADHPVRFLSYANETLSFGYDGEMYTMKAGAEPMKLPVSIRTQSAHNNDKFITINGGVSEMAVHPNGKEIAFIARGEVFVTSVDGSLTKRITTTPEQERFVTFSADGKSVVYSSERNGKWTVYESHKLRKEEPFFFAATLIEEQPMIESEVDNYLPRFSPDSTKVAFIANRRNLVVRNLKTGSENILFKADEMIHMRDGDKYYRWSPDSKWLLVGWRKSLNNSEVILISADGEKRENLTRSGFYDASPKWVNDGKQMIWFSNRNGLKSYATSGRTEMDAYAMFFEQEAYDKFMMSKEDYDLKKAIEESQEEAKANEKKNGKNKDKKEKEPKTEALTFDWEEMRERKVRLTIHSSNLGDAVLSKDGEKLYYLAAFEKGQNLWVTNLRTQETKMALSLDAKRGSLTWDAKKENLYLLSDGRISKIDPDEGKKKDVTIKGEMTYDEEAEFAHMFDHVWIRTKNIFYEPTFHGVNWELLRTEYEKYLPSIGNGHEFSELVSEMVGELNVSHAGSRYPGREVSNPDETASLGIFMDWNHQGDGVKIAEVIKGGPLDKAALKVEKGMVITAIDGEKITPSIDVAMLLNRKADKFTLLEVTDPAGKTKQVVVKPISLNAESRLLYKRFVRINEKEVSEKSGGRLGYVHIPGMSDGPYRDMFEKMMGKYFESEAVIIDTRFNGGGDLVADLAMFFTGEPFITYATESAVVGGEPTSRWTKPTLALFNESMYSDGHCFASGYTDLEIGKTVGMPVPGTCSFAGWEGLPNGSRWGVVPVSAKNKANEWMENNQTEPQIIVKNMPGQIDQGIDQQLDRAVEELLKDLNTGED
ncbi:peptidase S41 [Robertkochia marina]|uniref:Tricorn protease homolog n=1 Tax=Robertkochia marina TaxID=1227945 RepID=A0A4S3M2N0_9FLAO|nr:S41 family peptidase [Robertkochia marina]THD69326.1 peptidase S41 [Robertkochia marina]TRZ47413.1 peptidase S41 [Robertkochia marina]